MDRTKINLGFDGLEELFMTDEERKENKLPKVFQVPISEIDAFRDHPFRIKNDEDMDRLVESVKERGVITPVILRRKDSGRYETVSGHRRIKACKLAGFDTVPAEIRELTKDEATILMVDCNLQRTNILPSEKAFAYKMKLEAMNRQGQRSDLTSCPLGTKLRSDENLADKSSDGARQIHRYIRLTYLIPEILEMVDNAVLKDKEELQIAMRPAVEISYFKEDEQKALLESMRGEDRTPSHAQTLKMKQFSMDGRLTPEVIDSIMQEDKPNQKLKIHINYDDVKDYLPKNLEQKNVGDYVVKALTHYRHYLARKEREPR